MSKNLNFVENVFKKNLRSDMFLRIKEVAVRSFHHGFYLSKSSFGSIDFCPGEGLQVTNFDHCLHVVMVIGNV